MGNPGSTDESVLQLLPVHSAQALQTQGTSPSCGLTYDEIRLRREYIGLQNDELSLQIRKKENQAARKKKEGEENAGAAVVLLIVVL
ncbi:hypothetical protein VE00_10959 [Pseudogymnoascus sp. WSF 3629]|nr:hypothetical protein VE00_10959 [Pseudogymnoascus sp. WSF 3629]